MSSSLLDLNDDCLVSVLGYLPLKDHLHFAHVCTRFRNVLMDYAKSLYKTVEVTGSPGEMVLMRVVGDLVEHLYFKYYTKCVRNVQRILHKTMRRLVNLEHATLNFSCTPTTNAIKAIFRVLEELPKIKGIGVFEKSDHVYQLLVYRDSESLLRDPYFKRGFQSSIFILEKTNNSVEESLAYIVPHLPSVKSVSITMNLPTEYYRPLSRVSKLQEISIYPSRYHKCGPLLPLMASLASGLHGQLTDLTILARAVSYNETREIAQMVNLRNLHCDFEEPRCLEHLTALKQLITLNIGEGLATQSDVTNLILPIIRACTGLNILMATVNSSQLATDFFFKALEVLKTVRDPSKQKPLGLGFSFNTRITNEELTPYLWCLEYVNMG